MLKLTNKNRKNKRLLTYKPIIILSLVLMITLLFLIMIDSLPLNKLPSYPFAKPIVSANTTLLEQTLKSGWSNGTEGFNITNSINYQLYTTTDSTHNIINFYKDAGRINDLKELVLNYSQFDQDFIIFGRSVNSIFPDQNITMMKLFDESVPSQAVIVEQIIGQPLPNIKIIVLMQAFAHIYKN